MFGWKLPVQSFKIRRGKEEGRKTYNMCVRACECLCVCRVIY